MPFKKSMIRKEVGFTPAEWELVCKKAETADMRVGTFIRNAAVHGDVKVYDISEVMHLRQSLNKVGTNINQIARVANSTNSIYRKDIDELKEQFAYFDRVLKKHMDGFKPKEIL